MSEVKDYTDKTFECGYGRHALVHSDTEPPTGIDIKWVLPEEQGRWIHPTRLAHSYRPRHAMPGPLTDLDLFIAQLGVRAAVASAEADNRAEAAELADQAQAWRER